MNNGDPLKTIKALKDVGVLKGVAVSMLSAGIMHELALKLDIKDSAIKQNLSRASVNAALNVTFNDQSISEALLNSLGEAAIGTVASTVTPVDATIMQQNIIRTVFGGVKEVAVGRNGLLVGALENVVAGMVQRMVDDQKREQALKSKHKIDSSLLSKEATNKGVKPRISDHSSSSAKPQKVEKAKPTVKNKDGSIKTETFSERFGKGPDSSKAASEQAKPGKYNMRYESAGNAFWPILARRGSRPYKG